MGLPLLIFGAILITVGFTGKASQLGSYLQRDIEGYFKWALAISAVGAIGIPKQTRSISIALLLLIFIVAFLKNGTGLFARISELAGGNIPSSGPSRGLPQVAPAQQGGTGLAPEGLGGAVPAGSPQAPLLFG